jgi:hypothetical protein
VDGVLARYRKLNGRVPSVLNYPKSGGWPISVGLSLFPNLSSTHSLLNLDVDTKKGSRKFLSVIAWLSEQLSIIAIANGEMRVIAAGETQPGTVLPITCPRSWTPHACRKNTMTDIQCQALTTGVYCVPDATLSSSIWRKNVKCRAVLGWRYGHVCGELERYADGIHSEAWVYRQSARLVDRALLLPPHLSRPKEGARGWNRG